MNTLNRFLLESRDTYSDNKMARQTPHARNSEGAIINENFLDISGDNNDNEFLDFSGASDQAGLDHLNDSDHVTVDALTELAQTGCESETLIQTLEARIKCG